MFLNSGTKAILNSLLQSEIKLRPVDDFVFNYVSVGKPHKAKGITNLSGRETRFFIHIDGSQGAGKKKLTWIIDHFISSNFTRFAT